MLFSEYDLFLGFQCHGHKGKKTQERKGKTIKMHYWEISKMKLMTQFVFQYCLMLMFDIKTKRYPVPVDQNF